MKCTMDKVQRTICMQAAPNGRREFQNSSIGDFYLVRIILFKWLNCCLSLLHPAKLGAISTAAGGFRYSAGVISIAEGKFHCPP